MRKIAITMFTFLCFIVSCNVEDNLNSEQNSTITATSKWFDESGVDLPILHYSKTPNWQNAIVSKKGNQTIIEVPLLLNDNFKVQNGDAQTYNRLLFCKDEEGKFEVYHLALSTSEKFDNNDKNLTFEKLLTSFSGNLNLVNANQEVVDPVTKTTKKRSSSLTSKEEETCTYLIEMYDDGSYEYRAKLFCGGIGGGTGTPSGGTKTGGAGGSGGTTPKSVTIQITDKLTGKAKCLNILLNNNGNSFVQDLLNKFAGNSEFNIQISSVDKVFDKSGNEINGNTTHIIGSSEMNIFISTSKSNDNSALETARVILHEYIHADIFRKTYTNQTKNQEVKDFKTTYDTYVKEKDHSTMATLYISGMKEALKDFHKNVLTDDYNKYINYYGEAPSDAFYEALAWGGLKDSNVKPWADLPQARKNEIIELAGRVTRFSKDVPCPK